LDIDLRDVSKLKTRNYLRRIGSELIENITLNKKLLNKIIKNNTYNIKKWRVYTNIHWDYLIKKAQNKI
jgi:hypothetical protein